MLAEEFWELKSTSHKRANVAYIVSTTKASGNGDFRQRGYAKTDWFLVGAGNRAMELQAELTGRDGLKRAWRVRCDPPGELRGLLAGLSQLREEVTARLGPLVQQESLAAAGDRDERGGDNGDEDEEEEEEEEGKHINTKGYSDEPPLKRTKPHS